MMYYQRRVSRKNGEDGISPVVGVMLMLVVTIIIAAVVSAFAGGSTVGSQKAPSANVEIHIKNGGTVNTSYFSMNVLGVSEPIPTKNLRIITFWTTTGKDLADSSTRGSLITGGGTSNGTAAAYVPSDLTGSSGPFNVPTGYGNGVRNVSNDTYHTPEAQWGNFSLVSGTSTFDRPASTYGTGSSGSYFYGATTTTPTTFDSLQVILGRNWSFLRAGDTVAVRIVDMRSGKTFVDQNVQVEG